LLCFSLFEFQWRKHERVILKRRGFGLEFFREFENKQGLICR